MVWIAIFFFFSGLCSILYELVWLRLAMAKFGVTTALVSIVLSVFMAGLGAGSWIAGWATRRYGEPPHRAPLDSAQGRLPRRSLGTPNLPPRQVQKQDLSGTPGPHIWFFPLRLYGVIELLIGISALTVPLELAWGSRLLEKLAGQVSISSGAFYLLSGPWLALTLLPWCVCMGATIPVAMFAIRRSLGNESQRSFSFLYLSNVIGAVAGASLAPALVELYGFHGTLRTGAVLNALIFVSALILSFARAESPSAVAVAAPPDEPAAPTARDNTALLLLFTTGLTTMGMEVIWIRLYTYFIDPLVYSFALILASYLAATFIGSSVYRLWSRRRRERESALLWISLALFGLLPLVTADPRLAMNADLRVVVGVAPFAGIVGFLTPMLVDRWSGGVPDRAGRAYAVNVVGCIIGPLLAGFVLLPLLGEHVSMLVLVLPWFTMAIRGARRPAAAGFQIASSAALLIAALTLFFFTKDYEALYDDGVILRDSTATTIATGKGMDKMLLVNGVGMTSLTPITKMMAHFTLAHLQQPPRNALIICFGMGTTFRSAMSWGIPVTVVELAPSVPKVFSYFHPDGGALLTSPRAHVVIDDGRRFLDRSAEKFDAIIIDPPPPVDAAGSSLLYSRDFYVLARQHLRPDGILQQWLYEGDNADWAAVTRALQDVFPYVRVYAEVSGGEGRHFLASPQPIPERTAQELVARMPASAIQDMMEWGPAKTPPQQLELMVSHEVSPQSLIALAPRTPDLEDDRPINEYDALRVRFPQWMSARAGQ